MTNQVMVILLTPVVCESIQEVICFEHRWKVIDLDHMAKLIRVDAHILIHRVVIMDVLNGKRHCLFQMCLDLKDKEDSWVQVTALISPQRERMFIPTIHIE